MTAVGFPDISVVSQQGMYRAEARSPDNKTIKRRDGSPPDTATLGYMFSDHHCGLRYQLMDNRTSRVVWERWQGAENHRRMGCMCQTPVGR